MCLMPTMAHESETDFIVQHTQRSSFLESGPSQHSNSEDMIRMTVTVYFLLCLRVFVRSNIHYHSYNPLARTQAKSIRSYHALRTMTPEFHRLPLLSWHDSLLLGDNYLLPTGKDILFPEDPRKVTTNKALSSSWLFFLHIVFFLSTNPF